VTTAKPFSIRQEASGPWTSDPDYLPSAVRFLSGCDAIRDFESDRVVTEAGCSQNQRLTILRMTQVAILAQGMRKLPFCDSACEGRDMKCD